MKKITILCLMALLTVGLYGCEKADETNQLTR